MKIEMHGSFEPVSWPIVDISSYKEDHITSANVTTWLLLAGPVRLYLTSWNKKGKDNDSEYPGPGHIP